MRVAQLIGCLTISLVPSLIAQQQNSSAGATPVQTNVYSPGPDVTAPELLPFNVTINPPKSCKQKMDGTVGLFLLVDETGMPRDVMFLKPLANDLDRLALQVVGADRFKPGTHEGKPVVVEQSLQVGIKGCVEETVDSAGKKSLQLRVRALPEQELGTPAGPLSKAITLSPDTGAKDAQADTTHPAHVGAGVSPPVPLNTVVAQYTQEARRTKINGYCLVSVTVDAHGMPQSLRIIKSLDPGLDQNALIAAGKYRFMPAMKKGTPVPVMITVEVNFRLY
jgi:TonB family protein